MGVRFEDFELDAARFELRKAGVPVHVEPQVLALILLLVDNRDRLVSRDELVERIWDGRVVSEAAISSRIKSARHALDDDGTAQRLIRTVHGKGFRFVGSVERSASPDPVPPVAKAAEFAGETVAPVLSRPSIAVLPLEPLGDLGDDALIADALPHELITELSRLRWIFVIARGSSFRLRGPDPDVRAIGARLGVSYCLCGTLRRAGRDMLVTLELSDTRDRGLVWSERFRVAPDAVAALKLDITARVVAALEVRIPGNEARRARLRAPEHLDAWSAYHLGLQHMYRFTRTDNQRAGRLFELAIEREPDFARAYAGLSASHFQNAFLEYTADVRSERSAARRHAERAVELEPDDPFANFTLGRSLWLADDVERSLGWLDRAIDLSPNYAQGIYARAWAETVLGRGIEGQQHADEAMALSPIDPLHYAMLGTRALSHLVRGEDAEAALSAERAARAPGAHALIAIIAAACHGAAGEMEKSDYWASSARKRMPSVSQAQFFRSFPFADAAVRRRIGEVLTLAGI